MVYYVIRRFKFDKGLKVGVGVSCVVPVVHRQDNMFDTVRVNTGKDCGVKWVYLLKTNKQVW